MSKSNVFNTYCLLICFEGNINVSFAALIFHNLVHVRWFVEKKEKYDIQSFFFNSHLQF